MEMLARKTVVGVLAACSLAAVPASAEAAFSTPIPVSGADAAVRGPAVNASSDGQYVAWVRASDHHVLARWVSNDGSMSAINDISGDASKSDGATTVVAAGRFSRATFSWMRASDQHVVAVRYSPSGPNVVVDVSQGSVAGSSQSHAHADAGGQVHFVWRNGSNSHVLSRSLSSAGLLSSVTDVSLTDDEAALWGTAPNVTADASGNRYFTYHRNTDCHIMLREVSAAGILGPAIDVSQTPDKAVGDTSPAIAAAGSNVLLVWHRDGDQYDHGDDTVYFNFVLGGTTAGTPTPLSAVGDVSMMGIGAAGGPDGGFGVVWQGRTSGEVWYRAVGSSGVALETPQQLSSGASRTDAAPAIGIDEKAGAAVAWSSDSDGSVKLTSSAGTYKPSPPPSPLTNVVRLDEKSISLRSNTLSFKLTCVAGSSSDCIGRAKLSDAKRKNRWGGKTYGIAPGATMKIRIKLNRSARKKLRAGGKLKGHLTIFVDAGKTFGLPVKLKRR